MAQPPSSAMFSALAIAVPGPTAGGPLGATLTGAALTAADGGASASAPNGDNSIDCSDVDNSSDPRGLLCVLAVISASGDICGRMVIGGSSGSSSGDCSGGCDCETSVCSITGGCI